MVKQVIPAQTIGLHQGMVDPDALQVISRLKQNGYAAAIVGGGVRDLLLGRKPKDFDIVTDAVPEKIRRIFGRNSMIIGRRFKIVHVYFEHLNVERSEKLGRPCYDKHIIEVSTYRSNQVHLDTLSEHGRILVDNNYGTMDQDAFRRDFTVNALYYDPLDEEVIDYHQGLEDINRRVMRIIGNAYERYLEDPVRVLRAIRLAQKVGLTIDAETYINFQNAKHLLLNEPRGRLFEEMLKILLSGNAVAVVRELTELKLPRRVFPLLDKLFFSAPEDSFALMVLAKTDLRINNDEDVSLIYILAGLVWPTIYSYLLRLDPEIPLRQRLIDAIGQANHLVFNCGITRNLYHAMREIWLLQADFEAPTPERLHHLITHNRFRQAWHLMNLRFEFQQVELSIFNWWERFVAEENADKTELLIELVDMLPENRPKKKRKKRRRKKSVAGAATHENITS
jgi:poly(A) polymerase